MSRFIERGAGRAPIPAQETISDSERVDQYFEQLLDNERVGYNSYASYNVHRSSWVQWHRLSKSWFEHTSDLGALTGKRTNHKIRLTDGYFETYYKQRFTRLFLLDPDEDIAKLKDKSPKALIKLARKDPPEVLVARLREQ